MTSIVLIGSGHVAHHFGRAFSEKGLAVRQVYSRTARHAEVLARNLSATPITDLGQVDLTADLYLVAVQDDAIQQVVAQLPNDFTGMVVHTSGATSSEVLEQFDRYGVLYPLQSMRKELKVDLRQIPLTVEGNTEACERQLLELAGLLSNHVFPCTSEQRLVLHLSAVFVNNFANALFGIAYDLTQQYGVSFDLLRPIILKTAENVQKYSPDDVQTGPAIRNDQNTIQKHLDFLKKHPEYREIYNVISECIQKRK